MDMPVLAQLHALGVVVLLAGLAWTALLGAVWVTKRTWRIIVRL